MYPGTLYPGGKTNHPWKNPVLGATPVYSWFFTLEVEEANAYPRLLARNHELRGREVG